ncbi:MAG: hypothetical protein GF401_09480 [Chitinivibrionales bacterium]|nr:hypothetical protein [Chitinivibrionales bacterium]
MKNAELFIPQLDAIIEAAGGESKYIDCNNKAYRCNICDSILPRIRTLLQESIKPKTTQYNKTWNLWFVLKRGPISAYTTDEEYEQMLEHEEIESHEELEEYWVMEYPYEEEWIKVTFILQENEFSVLINTALHFLYNFDTCEIIGGALNTPKGEVLLRWLEGRIKREIEAFLKDPDAYNRNVEEKLPLRKRIGRISRHFLWKQIPDLERLDRELGDEIIHTLERALNNINRNNPLFRMTADDFFGYCEICYDANDYFGHDEKLTPRQKYKRMADGRDEGLLEVSGDSPEAFYEWFANRNHRGHPWEICRGGTTSHISLIVNSTRDPWYLSLSGFGRVRAAETVRMAVALWKAAIPFRLLKASELLAMCKGTDYVGIVPDYVTPRYCGDLFPDEDAIIDYMNPWDDQVFESVVRKYAYWYPLEKLETQHI